MTSAGPSQRVVMPSHEQRRAFAANGFVTVERLLPDSEVTKIRSAMNRVYRGEFRHDRRPPAHRKTGVERLGDDDSVSWLQNARLLDPDLWAVATSDAIAGFAAELLEEPSVSVIEDQLLDKPPGSAPVAMHQDYAYWDFSSSANMVTCWLALSPMTVEIGTLHHVPGSHLWGLCPRPKSLVKAADDDWCDAARRSLPESTELETVPVLTPAGGAVFFHALTFHGSPRNLGTTTRGAFSIHYAGAECRLERDGLIDNNYLYCFDGLKTGEPLVNEYFPSIRCAR
ncbi:MAG: Phytanoyl-CoA dioxygenase [Myxococcales bacterium]|nr:Phytanoyl-CoA dioxygenase [Myxococcales bacterium]